MSTRCLPRDSRYLQWLTVHRVVCRLTSKIRTASASAVIFALQFVQRWGQATSALPLLRRFSCATVAELTFEYCKNLAERRSDPLFFKPDFLDSRKVGKIFDTVLS